jgi:chromosome partitioning protein
VEDPLLTAAAEAPGVGADPAHAAEAPTARPYVLVLGNEKGGTGKSTTAVHVIVGLLQLGYRVGSLDVDGRQGTLSAYLGNRARAIKKTGADLAMPLHRRVEGTTAESRARSFEHETERFTKAFADLAGCQFVVVDTPGSDANLTRLGHGIADTLITPVNDSFLDLDVIAKLNAASRQVLAPSVYTIAALLDKLAGRVGFRIAPGFGERMIFRELFLRGLTLLDVPETSDPRGANASHAAARREVANLLSAIGVPAPALSREAGS